MECKSSHSTSVREALAGSLINHIWTSKNLRRRKHVCPAPEGKWAALHQLNPGSPEHLAIPAFHRMLWLGGFRQVNVCTGEGSGCKTFSRTQEISQGKERLGLSHHV